MAKCRKLKPVVDDEDGFKCFFCDEFVSNAVKCSGEDLFCLDCIGAYADLLGKLTITRSSNGDLIITTVSPTRTSRSINVVNHNSGSGSIIIGSGAQRDACAYRSATTSAADYYYSLTIPGGSVTTSRTHEFCNGERCAEFLDSIRINTNRCPKCGVEGAYSLSPGTDRELANQEVRCPYVNTEGSHCIWAGRFAAFRGHRHNLGLADGADDDVTGLEDDDLEDEGVSVRVLIDDKVIELKKSVDRDVKTVSMSIKI